MVGDSLGDIEAGVRAGCGKVIFVLSSGFTEHELWTKWEKRVDESEILKEIIGEDLAADVKAHGTDSVSQSIYSESNVIQKDFKHKYSQLRHTEIVVVDDIRFVSREIGL